MLWKTGISLYQYCSSYYIFFCLTSKMSHDHSRHDSCGLRLYSRWIHSIMLSLARGMTAVGVGSGALLALFSLEVRRSIAGSRDLAEEMVMKSSDKPCGNAP